MGVAEKINEREQHNLNKFTNTHFVFIIIENNFFRKFDFL